VAIVLHKTEYVLDHLSASASHEPESKSGKGQSSVGKRSALSESVEIYKLKKQEESEKDRKVKGSMSEPYRSRNAIPSDYKLVCKARPEERRAEQGTACCFK
jgi:hypothetical protein